MSKKRGRDRSATFIGREGKIFKREEISAFVLGVSLLDQLSTLMESKLRRGMRFREGGEKFEEIEGK